MEEDEIKTVKLQEHIPNSVGIKYNCIHEKYTEPIKIINNSDPEKLYKRNYRNNRELCYCFISIIRKK